MRQIYVLAINFPQAAVDTPRMVEQILPSTFEREFVFPESEGDFISSGINEDAEIFQATTDGDPIVRTFNNFTVQAGHGVRPNVRCKGLYLNILGDLHLEGWISMTARGAKGQGKYVGIFPDYDRIYYCNAASDYDVCIPSVSRLIIGAVGGKGGSRPSASTWQSYGGAGINNAGGGGASGAGGGTVAAGCNNGSAGTSFSGGSGGGGIVLYGGSGSVASAAEAYGGRGGYGYRNQTGQYTCSAGVGNPSGSTYLASTSPSGTGGLLIVVVHGNVIIPNSANQAGLWANGVSATSASNPGGGSGGGIIHLFCFGEYLNKGTISVAGGNYAGAGSKTGWQKVNGVWQRLTV